LLAKEAQKRKRNVLNIYKIQNKLNNFRILYEAAYKKKKATIIDKINDRNTYNAIYFFLFGVFIEGEKKKWVLSCFRSTFDWHFKLRTRRKK